MAEKIERFPGGLSEELKELLLGHLIAEKLREKEAMGWGEVHETLRKNIGGKDPKSSHFLYNFVWQEGEGAAGFLLQHLWNT